MFHCMKLYEPNWGDDPAAEGPGLWLNIAQLWFSQQTREMLHVSLNCLLPALESDTALISSLALQGNRRTQREAHSLGSALGGMQRRSCYWRSRRKVLHWSMVPQPVCLGRATRKLRGVFLHFSFGNLTFLTESNFGSLVLLQALHRR